MMHKFVVAFEFFYTKNLLGGSRICRGTKCRVYRTSKSNLYLFFKIEIFLVYDQEQGKLGVSL